MMFFRSPRGKIFLATIDIVASVSSTPRYSRPPRRIRTQNTRSVGPPERPCQNSQPVVGPGRTPERTSGRGWKSAPTRGPHTQAISAPPGHPRAAPTARKSARCGVGDGSPRPTPPHPQPVASGPRPHARTDERSGAGERPTPDTPHQGKRCPPWAASCRPHSAQSQLARARAVGLVTGPHPTHPRPQHGGGRPQQPTQWAGSRGRGSA